MLVRTIGAKGGVEKSTVTMKDMAKVV